jgi:hypothetical protein
MTKTEIIDRIAIVFNNLEHNEDTENANLLAELMKDISGEQYKARYILKRDLPNLCKGAIFYQSEMSDNIYFHAIAINSDIPATDQVGIIRFEANDVENNPDWFERKLK